MSQVIRSVASSGKAVRSKVIWIWETHREDEVSRPPVAGLRSTQNPIAISSLNEAWLHTLDEYVADTPLSQVIVPVGRAGVVDGGGDAVLLAQEGHGNQVAADITGFITEQPRS